MKRISSRANPTIKHVASLASSSERERQGLFIAEGLRTCTTLCSSGIKLQQLFVTPPMVAHALKLTNDLMITEVTHPVMEKISQMTTQSGMLGVFHIPETPHALRDSGIVLAQLREPGNVGTLIRTCAAFGMRSVVLVETVDAWSPKVVQASAGALGFVDIFVMSWEELRVRKGSYKLCALVVNGGYPATDLLVTHSLLVIGNESQGVPAAWIKECDQHMTLPMPGGVIDSLNAAVAGSIALYEMMNSKALQV